MEQKLKKLKNEWEKIFLSASIVLATFSFLFLIIKVIYSERQSNLGSPSLPHTISLLNRSAFGFLSENPNGGNVSDPFYVHKILAKYAAKPKNTTENINKPQKLSPPKPNKFVTVSYSGWLDSSSGEKIAFISALDETTNQKKSYTSSEGTKFSQFTLSKIENDYIIILDSKNREHKIKIHSNIKIQIE